MRAAPPRRTRWTRPSRRAAMRSWRSSGAARRRSAPRSPAGAGQCAARGAGQGDRGVGGGPSLDWLAGGEHCGTVGDLLADATRAKHDVVIVDRTGRPQALATTLHRAEHGRRLQRGHAGRDHGSGDGIFIPRHLPDALRRACRARDRGSSEAARGAARERPGLEVAARPGGPGGGGFALHPVGDAVNGRGVHAGNHDALRLGMAL